METTMLVCAFVMVASLGMCLGGPVPFAQDLGSCVNDKDCYVSKTYCYQTGKCVFCTDCSVHQRQNATDGSCAKNKDECGDCLPGKKAEINFDKSFTCIGIQDSNFPNTEIVTTDSTTNSLDSDQNQNSNTGWIIYSSIAVASILLITFIIFVIIVFTKHCKTTVFTTLKNRVLMPSSSSTEPTAPNLNQMNNRETVHEEYRRQSDYRPVESDRKLTANAYANPFYVRGGTLANPDEPDNQPQPEEEQLIAPTANLVDDEETIPSAWTPERIAPEDRLTSFANLNLNSNSQPARVLYTPTPHQDNNSNRDSFHRQEETASNENASYNTTNNPSGSSGPQVNIQILNVVANTQIRH